MDDDSFQVDNSLRGILARAVLWTMICGITAIPSFVWARSEFSTPGMVVGVALFVAMYTMVSGTSAVARWRTSRLTDRTFRIGYFTRVVVSAIVPLGMALDLVPGIVSVSLVEAVMNPRIPAMSGGRGFFVTLVITLVQGTLLHITLGAYMLVVHLIQWWWVGKEYPKGHCRRCGYDLRASYEFGRCPECGAPCGPEARADRGTLGFSGTHADLAGNQARSASAAATSPDGPPGAGVPSPGTPPNRDGDPQAPARGQ
ncbi:MAG TPA: zinc ribbon domain-containing protein [Phycisphaerae bacterium]|nr:zinc ribbon domain-containing protein [Phycisphaerae bacterium]HRY68142.1 zinc ribbon domain-containing protein [Phycisphaerae bacterium]HSA27038.1 zinc ribbon domain-containing protein [Phycisphaerae bacterium]